MFSYLYIEQIEILKRKFIKKRKTNNGNKTNYN